MQVTYGATLENAERRYELITEAELSNKDIVCVYKEKLRPNVYHVCVNNIVMHPEVSADGALRALGNYLHNEGFLQQKVKINN